MIIFLYGADTYRSQCFLKELKEKFITNVDPGAFSLNTLDGRTINIDKISQHIGAGSLFVKKRMVVIENIFQNKKEKIWEDLLHYLNKLGDRDTENNILIFREEESVNSNKSMPAGAKKLFNFLSQQKHVQEFKLLKGPALLSFIVKEAKKYHKKIDTGAATELLTRTNGDSWLLAGAIKKLAYYSSNSSINKQSVQEMVSGIYDENIFALTDALSARQKSAALRLLEEQYAAGLSSEYLLSMLIRQFKILGQLRAAMDGNTDQAKLALKLKLHPFVVKKGLSQAKNFSNNFLISTLNELVHLDYLSKNGKEDIKTKLFLLISRL